MSAKNLSESFSQALKYCLYQVIGTPHVPPLEHQPSGSLSTQPVYKQCQLDFFKAVLKLEKMFNCAFQRMCADIPFLYFSDQSLTQTIPF